MACPFKREIDTFADTANIRVPWGNVKNAAYYQAWVNLDPARV